MSNPKYSYIRWLPRNRIIVSTVSSLLNSPYLQGIFGQHIYGYYRDDNGIETLPSLSVYHGQLYSADNYDIIKGTIVIECYDSLDLTRNSVTESIDTILETIRITIQNNNFAQQVALDQFDYNETLSTLQSPMDKKNFAWAMANRNPLKRYGIEFNVEQPTVMNPKEIGDCQKIKMTFKYWIAQQDWMAVLDIMGISFLTDPNRIIYPPFEQFNIGINQPVPSLFWILDESELDLNTILS